VRNLPRTMKTITNAGDRQCDLTTAAIATPASPAQKAALPEFIRIPSKGREPWTGLSHAQLYQLISRGEIKSVSLRREGTTRGTRLIYLRSLLDFLNSRIEGGQNRPSAKLARLESKTK